MGAQGPHPDPAPARQPRRVARVMATALPTPWTLFVLAIWWSWRWTGSAGLPGFGGGLTALSTLLGFAQDALLLHALFALGRWQAGTRHVRGVAPGGGAERLAAGAAIFALSLSALLRGLDAAHVHLAGRHMGPRFWQGLAENTASWLSGLHTVLLLVLLSALGARVALRRDRSWGPTMARRMGGAQPGRWLRSLAISAVISGLAGVALVALGGVQEQSTATLPELVALRALWHALVAG